MKQTRLWLLTMAVLLCSVTQLKAETIYLNDWTSTNKTNNSTSYETYTFTTYPGGSLSFDWYVSSESGYDWLTITLDGTQIVHQSGNSYSGNYSNENLSEGDHTLVVQYSKDGSQSNGSDLARITNIVVDEGYMDEVIQDGVSYRLSGNGTASVYALVDTTKSEITIPSIVIKDDVDYTVTSIGSSAFANSNSIVSVSIPESVTTIENKAFYYCENLIDVTIMGSLTKLGDYAFQYCTKLENLTFVGGLTNIGMAAISHCNMLKEVSLPEGVEVIDEYVFDNSGIESIVIPASVTSIGNYAFNGCASLKEIIVADGANTLSLGYNGSYGLFSSCPLETIYLGRNLSYSYGSSYGYSPFYNRDALTSVVIGDSVTSIGSYAFYSCGNLATVTIGDNVTSIGSYAFQYCNSLSMVYNRSDLNIVKGNSNYGYVGCYANQVIKGDTLVGDYYFYTTNDGDHYLSYYAGQDSMIVLPASYNGESYAIANDAFYDNDALVSVVISDSVTSIGSNAFYSCGNLVTVTIGDDVTSIGSSAFSGCNSLSSITIPASVTSINNYAFDNCTGITEVTFADGTNTLSLGYGYSYGLFDNSPLESVYLGRNLSFNTTYYSPFYNRDALTSVVIGDSVTSIGSNAFYSCGNLATVTIGDNVTSIGSYAFEYCNNLSVVYNRSALNIIKGNSGYGYIGYYADQVIKVDNIVGDYYFYTTNDGDHYLSYYAGQDSMIVLPDSYNGESYAIANDAFYNNDALVSVVISDSVISIGSNAFYSCGNLATVTIGDNVTSIDSYAFEYCNNLSVVYNRSALNIIKGNSSYGYIGYYADQVIKVDNIVDDYYFYTTNDGDHYLSYYAGQDSMIILPASYNGESYAIANEAFYNNDALVSVVISDSVISIGSNAFYSCGNLATVTIGDNVTSIGSNAFYDCNALASIAIPSSIISINNYAFDDCRGLREVTFVDGTNILSMGNYVFSDCPLETVHLGRNLTYNTDYSDRTPFYNKDSLCRLTLGNHVTSIGSYAFSGCDNIYSLTIHSGITSIGSYAFGSIKKVIWLTNTPPEGYTNANGAINFVSNEQYGSLNNVRVYPYLSSSFDVDGLKYVPVNPAERTCNVIDCAYDSIVSIVNVASNVSYRGVAMKVAGIESYAFAHNKYIEEVTISHEGNIGDQAFYDCDSLQSVSISNQGNIGDQAFYDCDGLQNVTISNQGNIGDQAFYDCDGLQNVTISNQGNIGDQAFYDCDGLQRAAISNQGSIGNQAFSYCDNLQTAIVENVVSADIPSGDMSIRFNDWTSTNHGDGSVSSETYTFTTDLGATLEFDWSVDSESGCDYLFVLLDGNYILERSGNASSTYRCELNQGSHTMEVFYRKDGSVNSGTDQAIVSNIVVTNLMYGYYEHIFPEWTSTNHGDGSTSSKTYTFVTDSEATLQFNWSVSSESGYDWLIAVLDGNTILERSGFNSGSYSTSLGMGSHTLMVRYSKDSSQSSGSDQASISDIVVTGLNNFYVSGIGNNAFAECPSLNNVVLGDSVRALGYGMFRGCINLQEVVLPDSAVLIGGYCFSDCPSLSTVVMPRNLQYIGNHAFSGCVALAEFVVPQAVKSIGAYAFDGCSSISEITIPQTANNIGSYAFRGCTSLSDVSIENRTEVLHLGSNGSFALFADCPLDSIYIGGKISCDLSEYSVPSPFYQNTSLRSVIIAGYEDEIYANEFYGCINLNDVTIGNAVRTIGEYAFSGCSNLESFIFGSNMESIGAEAFSDCTGLSSITSYAAIPPVCGSQALEDINKWECVLRVPTGYDSAYQTAEQWKDFFFVEDVLELEKYVLTYVVDGEVYQTDTLIHKAEIIMPEVPEREGYTFSGWSETLYFMPANDITVSGTFTINRYVVTFKIDDEVISSDSLEYGTSIVIPEVPAREGYTFHGWDEVAATVPACDLVYEGSYSVNSYVLTYMVDGDVWYTDSIAYGDTIIVIEEPVKEGYTFSGWTGILEIMPANDTIIVGEFIVNKYVVTFKIDDEVISSDSLEYGTSIVIPEVPAREGYTFHGWDEVAATVPACDLVYEGNYSVNSYVLTYMVDGGVWYTDSIAYGDTIIVIEEPVKDGYTFSGWGEVPATMPANDTTIVGAFIANIYKVYYYVGDELVHTVEVAYGDTIPEYVYEPATEGEIFAGWVGETYETMPAHDVTYVANIESGVEQLTIGNGELIIYDLSGRRIQVESLRELTTGVYIINGEKVVIK